MTADNRNIADQNEQGFTIEVSDLDLLRNGTSHSQKPKSTLRRAMVTALRVGRKKGRDDGDGLGVNTQFSSLLSEDDSSDCVQ